MKEPIEAATQRGVWEAALVRRMCEIILGNTFGNEELDSLALLVGHHPDVLNAFHMPTEEAAELVAWLRLTGEGQPRLSDEGYARLTRAADLLERQAAPVPVPVPQGEVGELVEFLRAWATLCPPTDKPSKFTRAADLLEQCHPTPVPISERLPGDELCWWFEADEDCGYGSNWTLLRIRGSATGYTHWLPATALPLPQGEVEE